MKRGRFDPNIEVVDKKESLKDGFGATPKWINENPELSVGARWLVGYLHSRPDTWCMSKKALMKVCNRGRKYVDGCINELKKAGILTIERTRRDDGNFEYFWTLYPLDPGTPTVVPQGPLNPGKSTRTPPGVYGGKPQAAKGSSRKSTVVPQGVYGGKPRKPGKTQTAKGSSGKSTVVPLSGDGQGAPNNIHVYKKGNIHVPRYESRSDPPGEAREEKTPPGPTDPDGKNGQETTLIGEWQKTPTDPPDDQTGGNPEDEAQPGDGDTNGKTETTLIGERQKTTPGPTDDQTNGDHEGEKPKLKVVHPPDPPKGMDPKVWELIQDDDDPGRWIPVKKPSPQTHDGKPAFHVTTRLIEHLARPPVTELSREQAVSLVWRWADEYVTRGRLRFEKVAGVILKYLIDAEGNGINREARERAV